MPGSTACVKKSFSFKEWHPAIHHHQPFNLVGGSKNITLCNSVLNPLFPKTPHQGCCFLG